MFDNIFTSSPAVWSALVAGLIALPILIHLINLLRHQKVEWAAMDFLLLSHKKNRNWVRFKQILLLLTRIAVLLLALLMLGQVGCQDNRISRILGGSTTHHYILLDDSFSMSDQGDEGSAFDHATSTLSQIAARAKNRQNQLVTLLRFSSSRSPNLPPEKSMTAVTEDADRFNQVADLNGELVDNLFDQRIEDVKSRLLISNLNVRLSGVLGLVEKLIAERKQENAIVYVISDFREKDWKNPGRVADNMRRIRKSGAAIELIQCATTEHPNLAITSMEPDGNVRVAGTPLVIKISVKNCSKFSAEKIQLKVRAISIGEADSVAGEDFIRETELPTVFVSKIAPGQSETRKFPVFFETTGQHVVVAKLPRDAIAIDNRRWCCTEIRSAARVLIVDGTPSQESRFLSLALNPNRMTGVQCDVQTKAFLRDANPAQLDRYDVIFMLGVDSLENVAVGNLESFVRNGGGLVFACGPRINEKFYNEMLYRDGVGLLPLPLGRVESIPELTDNRIPDISPESHPVFAPVLGVKNSLLGLVQIEKIIAPRNDWIAAESENTILATVRGFRDRPLLVEKQFGKGRVALFTTTLGPTWNNWSRNATFPPILLLLEDHLAAGKYQRDVHLVGAPIRLIVTAANYLPTAEFEFQVTDTGETMSPDMNSGQISLLPTAGEPGLLEGSIGRFVPSALMGETDQPGIYDVALTRTDGERETRRYAVNVDANESLMGLANPQKLLADLEQAQPSLVDWDRFNPEPTRQPVSSLGRFLLILLVALLLSEQLVGYSASYHRN